MARYIQLLVLIPLTILLMFFASCSEGQQAMSKVTAGMTRAKAAEILSKTAWYYQPCSEITGKDGSLFVEDLFFFGSHNYDDVQIVIVHSRKQDSEWLVERTGTFEPNAWHTAYSHCFQRDKFEG